VGIFDSFTMSLKKYSSKKTRAPSSQHVQQLNWTIQQWQHWHWGQGHPKQRRRRGYFRRGGCDSRLQEPAEATTSSGYHHPTAGGRGSYPPPGCTTAGRGTASTTPTPTPTSTSWCRRNPGGIKGLRECGLFHWWARLWW
jgi:hypothetical protein